MAIAGLRFGHVTFRVADAERAVRWYADALGAKRIYHAPAQGDRPELMFLEFSRGQLIELFTGGKNLLPFPADPIGYVHFCVVVDDLEQALEHLAQMGVKPERRFIGARRSASPSLTTRKVTVSS